MSKTASSDLTSEKIKPRGQIEYIHIAADRKPAPMQSVDEVEAVADRGLRGDRYFKGIGKHNCREDLTSSDVTFIQAEAIESFNRDHETTIEPGETRRNITTRDVPLNHLVGKKFWVGEVKFIGIDMDEPCGSIADWIGHKEVVAGLMHQGGLNANVIKGGMIRVGDEIRY